MPKLNNRLPKYRLHKASGQAVVTLSGSDHYLGIYGTDESKKAYSRKMSEWLANAQLITNSPATGFSDATIDEVFLRYRGRKLCRAACCLFWRDSGNFCHHSQCHPNHCDHSTSPVLWNSFGGVQTGGGTATLTNGFTYQVPRGSGIELLGQVGGSLSALAIAGGYAYVGQGASLAVFNISDPSNPAPLGKIVLPSNVGGVAVAGTFAYVAAYDAGLYIIDVIGLTAARCIPADAKVAEVNVRQSVSQNRYNHYRSHLPIAAEPPFRCFPC